MACERVNVQPLDLERRCRKFLPPVIALMTALMMTVPGHASDPISFSLLAQSARTYAQPHDIVLSPDASALYVADNGNHRIAVLDPVSLKEIGVFGRGEVREPHDVAFDGAASGNLVVYKEGEVVGETGGFSSPHNVEFGPDGTTWVADAGNDRMVQLDEGLQIIRILTGPVYGFNGPRYHDFDTEGRMLVADKNSNQIKVIAPDGTLIQVLGTKARGMGEGLFYQPEGVEISGDRVWFSDTYNNRIVLYRMQ
jgi:DNA-binding beta-propeller fold protein YncE